MDCGSGPAKEHAWLKKLVGEWTFDAVCPGGPNGEGAMKHSGRESVRMLGDLWVLGEGSGQMPDGSPARMLLTLGFDPRKGKYVGSWIGSMMANMFVYEGTLSSDGKSLPLETDGPSFTDPAKTDRYRDEITFVSDTHRTLRSSVKGPDGTWQEFMKADYKRM